MQTRDEVRTQIRDEIQDAVRSATDAVREAQAEAGVVPGDALVLETLRAEIAGTRARVEALTQQLASADGPVRAALLKQVDLEQDQLSHLQEQLNVRLAGSSIPSTGFPDAPPPPPGALNISENGLGAIFFIAAALTVVGFPIARAVARWIDRRGTAPARSPDADQRLERIEQAIEAVAIEVERVSEGQRYNTKLMAEMRGLPAPNPLAEWQGVAPREPVAARKSE